MPKKGSKKSVKKGIPKKIAIKKSKQKSKLGAAKKECRNCGVAMPIHRKVCTDCGHMHQMRKNKEHIMKRINKMTPILVKSIIQNNDFNEFRPWNEDSLFQIGTLVKEKLENTNQRHPENSEPTNLKMFSRRRSSQTPKSQFQDSSTKKVFQMTNNKLFEFLKFQKPIGCLASSKNWLVIAESVSKTPVELQQKDQLTVQAYGLDHFTLVGVSYFGETILHFSHTPPELSDPTAFRFNTFSINRCIIRMKVFSNLLAMLTGESSLIFISLPQLKKNAGPAAYTLSNYLELIQPLPDRITCFEFLRSTAQPTRTSEAQSLGYHRSKSPEVEFAVGTLNGCISIYRLTNEGHSLIRYIPNAHMEMVTSISECPLNTSNQVMFASGSYDGNVQVWGLTEKSSIFSFQCSNRKVWSIYWDPGSKFLFINRDEMTETCIIACFYSINKIENCVNLSDAIETRTVKTNINATMAHHDFYSKSLPVLDPINGIFKLLPLQDLRGSSLKKKKPKKDDVDDKFFKIRLTGSQSEVVEIVELTDAEEQIPEKPGKIAQGQSKSFPAFSGMEIQCKHEAELIYFSTYSGILLVYKNAGKAQ